MPSDLRCASQLPKDLSTQILPHRSGDPEIQSLGLQTEAGAVRHVQPHFRICVSKIVFYRFQKAIKKVRATQRMRRQRGFAFSQTESKTQDQEKLIRAYDTSVQRPSGYQV